MNLNKFINTFGRGFQPSNRYLCQLIVRPQMLAQMVVDARNPIDTNFTEGETPVDRPLPLTTLLTNVNQVESLASVPEVVLWLAQGLLVSQCRLPDRGFAMADLTLYGYTEHVPVHTEYSTFDCSFRMPYAFNVLNDNGVPRFFSYWQNQIQHGLAGADSGMDFRFPSHYYGTILLTLLDRKNQGTITYQFDNAYPSVVQTTALKWDGETQFMELPVTFTYSYWKVLPFSTGLALSFVDKVLA